jgi:Squalene epoxidase
MTFPQAPQSSRGALMLPQEGQRWVLSLAGRGADKPPGDDAGFLNFARHLRTDTIYNAIRDARRVGAIHRCVFAQSVRRHFEKVPDFPRGLIPLGDAVCVFNPVYGQGMSVAAQEALLLRRLLEQCRGQNSALASLSQAFIAGLPALLETPWTMGAIPDFIFPQTIGERPPDLARRLRLSFAMLRLAARSPDVHKTITEVQHLLVPFGVYRRPVLMARLLIEMVRGRASWAATKVLVTPR